MIVGVLYISRAFFFLGHFKKEVKQHGVEIYTISMVEKKEEVLLLHNTCIGAVSFRS